MKKRSSGRNKKKKASCHVPSVFNRWNIGWLIPKQTIVTTNSTKQSNQTKQNSCEKHPSLPAASDPFPSWFSHTVPFGRHVMSYHPLKESLGHKPSHASPTSHSHGAPVDGSHRLWMGRMLNALWGPSVPLPPTKSKMFNFSGCDRCASHCNKRKDNPQSARSAPPSTVDGLCPCE